MFMYQEIYRLSGLMDSSKSCQWLFLKICAQSAMVNSVFWSFVNTIMLRPLREVGIVGKIKNCLLSLFQILFQKIDP